MNWTYKGKNFTTEMIEDNQAFVYKITNVSENKFYLGKKKFWNYRMKPPLKGQKRRRRIITESDWQDYWGSNDKLKEDVERLGPTSFKREILILCKTTGEASYHEAKLQFENDVLLREDSYNGIIQCRITGRHLSKGKS